MSETFTHSGYVAPATGDGPLTSTMTVIDTPRGPTISVDPTATTGVASRRKSRTHTHRIYLDPDLAEEYAEAAENLSLEKKIAPDGQVFRREEERVAALREAVEKSVRTIVFRAIDRKTFEDLVEAHPATEAQKEKAKALGREAGMNVDSLLPVLMHHCAFAPSLNPVEAVVEAADMPVGEYVELFWKLIEINSARTIGM